MSGSTNEFGEPGCGSAHLILFVDIEFLPVERNWEGTVEFYLGKEHSVLLVRP